MRKIGILLETKDDALKKTNFGVVTAARADDHELYGFLVGGGGDDHKAALEGYGISRLVNITAIDGVHDWNPVSWSGAIIDAMNHFGVNTLIGLTSAQGKELLPRIAAALDAPLVMDCIDLDLSHGRAKKSQFSGKTVATIQVKGPFYIYGVRPNVFEATPSHAGAEVITFQTDFESDGLVVKEVRQDDARGVDLTEADIIISGGRGMKNSDNFRILSECADLIGAAVGASRVAVDAGWVPHSMQVGQTGATVSPKVYIACGISGSVQHFAGMKTSGLIVAINTDAEANMVKKCDYYIVGDLFEIIPLLSSRLAEIVNMDQ